MFALAGAKVVVPSAVHVEPFAETDALTIVPLRESFSHAGGACDPYVISVVAAPVDDRVMNSIVPLGVTSRITWAAVAESDSRIMTPAFAHACVFCSDVTRATTWTLPFIGWKTYRNASLVPQISAPDPLTVNVPFDAEALPAMPVEPTSCVVHGDGSVPLGGGGGGGGGGGFAAVPAVVNDQIGDVPTSDGFTGVAFVRAITLQKYVVPV